MTRHSVDTTSVCNHAAEPVTSPNRTQRNCKQDASLTEQNNTLIRSLSYQDPHFGPFWGLGLLLGYLANSSAKSGVIFLLGKPDYFPLTWQNFTPISLSLQDWTQDRQTRQVTEATTITLIVCEHLSQRWSYIVTTLHHIATADTTVYNTIMYEFEIYCVGLIVLQLRLAQQRHSKILQLHQFVFVFQCNLLSKQTFVHNTM